MDSTPNPTASQRTTRIAVVTATRALACMATVVAALVPTSPTSAQAQVDVAVRLESAVVMAVPRAAVAVTTATTSAAVVRCLERAGDGVWYDLGAWAAVGDGEAWLSFRVRSDTAPNARAAESCASRSQPRAAQQGPDRLVRIQSAESNESRVLQLVVEHL